MIESKKKQEVLTATTIGPGDFPLGSLQSRAAARLRLQRIGETGRGSRSCICFPEDEQPFFCSLSEERIATAVKCPLHGERFSSPHFHIYVFSVVTGETTSHTPAEEYPVSEGLGRRFSGPFLAG